MRTIDDFRKRQIEVLRGALERPAMYCPTEFGAEMFLGYLLHDLCWIDEREQEWDKINEKFLWSDRRVVGQLQYQAVVMPDYDGEVTSTYAQVAHVLGYFRPVRLLTRSEWTDLRLSLDSEFFARTWHESDLRERFGVPSHEAYGAMTTVASYAPENAADGWVYFDIARRFEASDDYFADPILRDVRIERNRFQLLEFGDRYRRIANSPDFIGGEYGGTYASVVSIEGDHLDDIAGILRRVGYIVETSFMVQTREQAVAALNRKAGENRLAKLAYSADGWTHIVDPEMFLMAHGVWLELSKKWNNRVLGWGCFSCRGLTLFQAGKKLRDVVSCDGGTVVDRGDPLPEEAGIDWNKAEDDDVLGIAARLGAPYDSLADREYLVFHLDRSQVSDI